VVSSETTAFSDNRKEVGEEPFDVVIWGAEADTAHRQEAMKHFALLKRIERVTVLDFLGGVIAGTTSEQYLHRLYNARVRMLLLTPDFISELATNNLFTVASDELLRRRDRNRIIPVLLRPVDPCVLESDPLLKGLQPLPRNGKAISQQNKDDAWAKIANEVRAVLRKQAMRSHHD
jgi:hypothetical protein